MLGVTVKPSTAFLKVIEVAPLEVDSSYGISWPDSITASLRSCVNTRGLESTLPLFCSCMAAISSPSAPEASECTSAMLEEAADTGRLILGSSAKLASVGKTRAV